MLAVATRDSTEDILYAYARNRCDSVRFGLIALEGGAAEIGDLYNLAGKAGPTFIVRPDKTILDCNGTYSKYAIRKYFDSTGIETATCSDSLEVPTARFIDPGRAEVIQAKTQYEVIWSATDSDGILSRALYYSTDNGKTWEFLDSAETTDTTYLWSVPDANSTECRLKLHIYDARNNMKEKVSIYFTISGTSGLFKNATETTKIFRTMRGENGVNLYIPFGERCDVSLINVQGQKVAGFVTSPDKQWYTVDSNVSSGMHVISISKNGRKFGSWLVFLR